MMTLCNRDSDVALSLPDPAEPRVASLAPFLKLPSRMRWLCLLCVGCAGGAPAFCPDGWSVNQGSCAPGGDYLQRVHTEIGNGIFGYARQETGDCQPPVDQRSCQRKLVANLAVTAYRVGDLIPAPTAMCLYEYQLARGAFLRGFTYSGDDGAFELALSNGDYQLFTPDPLSTCFVGTGTVTVNGIVEQDLDFDHAAY
jgi:hypothetical protein